MERERSVAFFLATLGGGGAERVMLNLALGMAERGLKVDLVLANATGDYLSQVPPSIRVIDLGAGRVLASLPKLISYLRARQPSALIAAVGHVNVVALWAKRLARVQTRLIVTVHASMSRNSTTDHAFKRHLWTQLTRWFYPWADAIVSVSEGAADDLARLAGIPRTNITVISNPVVMPDLEQRAMEVPSHPWFSSSEPPVVLGVGRLTPQKDFPTLLRAFDEVRRKRSARLIILGEGPERSALENRVQEMGLEKLVDLPGFVSNPYAFMAKSAVFVLSSAWEALPTVLIESMAVGTPVIATDCPSGPWEILEGGKYGGLVPVGDAAALAAEIESVLGHDKTIEQRANIMARASEFGLSQSLDRYLAVLFPSNAVIGDARF